jgi:hypothetical protein
MKGYLIKAENDIEEVYKPSLDLLNANDDFFFLLFSFPLSAQTIKESMSFYSSFCYGEDDCEREYFDYKKFDYKNKGHHFKGINYENLNAKLDFRIFHDELTKLILDLESTFFQEIEDNRKYPNFEIPLSDNLNEIKLSMNILNKINYNNNRIKDIVKKCFLSSYQNVINVLRNKYSILYEKSFLILSDIDINTNESNITNDIDAKATNYSTSEFQENPHPRIFINNDAFLFFEKLSAFICKNKRTQLADHSFVFRKLQKDGLIYSDIAEKSFREFLSNHYEVDLDKLKILEYCTTALKETLYNQART